MYYFSPATKTKYQYGLVNDFSILLIIGLKRNPCRPQEQFITCTVRSERIRQLCAEHITETKAGRGCFSKVPERFPRRQMPQMNLRAFTRDVILTRTFNCHHDEYVDFEDDHKGIELQNKRNLRIRVQPSHEGNDFIPFQILDNQIHELKRPIRRWFK